jgi:NitT/TauT family transport system permease protein
MGFKSVDSEMPDLVRSMKASRWQVFVKISLRTRCRVSSAASRYRYSRRGRCSRGIAGANSGIGYVLQIANGNFDLPLMFAALVILSLVGVVLFAIVDAAERLMIPWHVSHRSDFLATA